MNHWQLSLLWPGTAQLALGRPRAALAYGLWGAVGVLGVGFATTLGIPVWLPLADVLVAIVVSAWHARIIERQQVG